MNSMMSNYELSYAEGMSAESSYEAASSRASSDGIRASAQGLRASALQLGLSSRQEPRASWQGLGAAKGRAAGDRAGGSSCSSDLDISCLVDNTPFKINEVCHVRVVCVHYIQQTLDKYSSQGGG